MSLINIIENSDKISDGYMPQEAEMKNFSADILRVLDKKNGFYSKNRSLLFRPYGKNSSPCGIIEWNKMPWWKDIYFRDGQNFLIFSEDAFGDPFFIMDSEIYKMDMETGDISFFASSLDDWADMVESDPNNHLNSAFMDIWVNVNGPVLPGFRICPKMPFVLGGEYNLANLAALPEKQIATFRSDLANQIRTLPDGAEIRININ